MGLGQAQVSLIRELVAAAIEEQFEAQPELSMPSTSRVLASLVQFGNQLGYFTVGPDDGAAWPGWVCDVCWVTLDPSGGIRGVALAVESEWGSSGDLHDDFAKLMVVRAELRVMLCQAADAAAVSRIADELHNLRTRFESGAPDDRYLLAAYDQQRRKVRFAEAFGPGPWAWSA